MSFVRALCGVDGEKFLIVVIEWIVPAKKWSELESIFRGIICGEGVAVSKLVSTR